MAGTHILQWLIIACLVGSSSILAGCQTAPQATPADALSGQVAATLVASAVVGPSGGAVVAQDGHVGLVLPPGAVGKDVEFRIYRQEPKPVLVAALPLPWQAPVTWRVEPQGLALVGQAQFYAVLPASHWPVAVEGADVDLMQKQGTSWHALANAWTAELPGWAGQPAKSAPVSGLGEFALAIRDPYAQPPKLTQLGINTPYSTVDGPKLALPPWGLHSLRGEGFGWDPAKIEVELAGQKMPLSGQPTNRWLEFQVALAQPKVQTEVQLLVRVQGQASNALTVRLQGLTSGQPLISQVYPLGGVFPGHQLRLSGTWYGAPEQMRVHLGELTLTPTLKAGELYVEVPATAEPGEVTLTADDGLGGAPSAPVAYQIYPLEPPQLTLGAHPAGLWLADQPPDNPAAYPPSLRLGVASLERQTAPYDQLAVRFQAVAKLTGKTVDSGWQQVAYPGQAGQVCAGVAAGLCQLQVPPEGVLGLGAGDTLQVQLRSTVALLPGEAPENTLIRHSNLLSVPIAGRGLLGATGHLNIGASGGGWWAEPCNPVQQPFATGDLLCFSLMYASKDCADGLPNCVGLHQVSAPGLWQGTLPFRWQWSLNQLQGLQNWCIPAPQPGTYTLQNLTLGSSCSFDVVSEGGGLGADNVAVDPQVGVELGMGGGRIAIPAGALPPLPQGGSYVVAALPQQKNAPKPQLWDPQQLAKAGAYHVQVLPEPGELLKPLTVTLPATPALEAKAPKLALVDPATGLSHLTPAVLDAKQHQLQWQVPAGKYAKPTSALSPKPAMPAPLNTVLAAMSVVYTQDAPGQIADLQGRWLVNYIVDPASADFCDEAYAADVLTAAVKAWETLENAGWRVPEGPITLFVRKNVSWASSTAKGATTAGVFGQPQITIKTGLSQENRFYVVSHEVGHLFQRQYTVNLSASWLDEAAAEWTAWQTYPLAFDLDGLVGESDAVQLVMAGLPSGWGGVAAAQIYASSVWLFWLADAKGPSAVRKLYEALDWSPSNWASAHATLEQATGSSPGALMIDFAEAFWLQKFKPMAGLDLHGDLAKAQVPANWTVPGAAGGQLVLQPRPALSSLRYRLGVGAALVNAVGSGDVLWRSSGLGTGAEVSVWYQAAAGTTVVAPALVTRLRDDQPLLIAKQLQAGTYWLIHHRWTAFGSAAGSVALELPRLTGLSPSKALPGQLVTVSGSALGAKGGQLRIGGTPVPVTSWGPAALQFSVPALANTQSVSVHVQTAEGAQTNDLWLAVGP